MFFFRNKLAFSAMLAIVVAGLKIAFDIVYKVLKILKLQLLLAVLFVGLVLLLTKVLFNPENMAITYIWIGFLALGFFYAVIGNMNRIRKLFSGVEKNRKEKLEERAKAEALREEKQKSKLKFEKIEENKSEPEIIPQVAENQIGQRTKEKYPKYYKVSQNNDYVMAEYKDRYELYVKKNGKLFKVRTDAKKESV